MKKKTKRILTSVGITAILVVCVIAAVVFWPKPGAGIDPNAGVFDIVVLDGSRGDELDLSDVRANLYLLPDDATDLTGGDWSEFENQTAIDTMNEIDEDDLQLDDGYVMAVVVYQVISTDIDGSTLQMDQNVQYYVREARLYAGRLNSLVLYETMQNGAQYTFYNANTGAVINTAAANITSIPCVNFTVGIMATNTSAFNIHQKYVSYWSYVNDDLADLSLRLNFNGTIKKNELVVSGGLSIGDPIGRVIPYHWSYLDSVSIQTYAFNWHVNVTGSYPTSWEVVVANVGVGGAVPVLAFNAVAI